MKSDGEREPLWREEFSVYAAEERYVSRRQFGKFLVLTSLGMFAGNLLDPGPSLWRAEPRAAGRARSRGCARNRRWAASRLFLSRRRDDPCILVRRPRTLSSPTARSARTSRAPSTTRPTAPPRVPCHEGYFSVEDGRVLQGPPPRPLPRILLEQRGDALAGGVDLQGGEETRADPTVPSSRRTAASSTAIDGAIALIAVLLIVQMWLLTATLESFLAGHRESPCPRRSLGVLFAACLASSSSSSGLDRRIRR